jgi:hypothetical protein
MNMCRVAAQLVVASFLVCSFMPLSAQTPQKPELSGLSQEDRASIESACSYEKLVVGPAAYRECVQNQLSKLAGSQKPKLSGVSQEDRASIESACSYEKLVVGPAAYHQCVQNQLSKLAGSKKPELSGASQEDRTSIESVCSYEKLVVGPAAYHQCVQNQLSKLAGSQRVDTSSGSHSSVARQLPSSALSLEPTAAQQTPTPGPELRRLGYFIGTWTLSGIINTSPFGPGGKFTGTHHNGWSSDSLSLVSQWDEQRPDGVDSGHAVYRYDSDQKIYRYNGVDSTGEAEDSTGTVEGNTWIWISNPTMENGETMKGRFTMKEVSSTSYSFRFETASANGEWKTAMEGNAAKTK